MASDIQFVGDELTGILAESAAMVAVMRLIDRAAQGDTPILLMGESGTGKSCWLERCTRRARARVVHFSR